MSRRCQDRICPDEPLGQRSRPVPSGRRLLRRHGPALTYDAVLTGFLLCGHLWTDQPGDWDGLWQRWTRRAEILIPPGTESSQFSAARIFATAYPEAVGLRPERTATPKWQWKAREKVTAATDKLAVDGAA